MQLPRPNSGCLAYFVTHDEFGIVNSLSQYGHEIVYVKWDHPDKMEPCYSMCWNGNLLFFDDISEQNKLAIRLKYGSEEAQSR